MIFRFMEKKFAAAALVTAAAAAAHARLQGSDNTDLANTLHSNDTNEHSSSFLPRKMESSIVQSVETINDTVDRSLTNNNEIQNELSDQDADEADLGVLETGNRELMPAKDCDSCGNRPVIPFDAEMYDLVDACYYETNDCPGEDISCWDTSRVVNMTYAFLYQSYFDDPLNCWDTGSTKSMYAMFSYAYEFNQDISGFDTSKVTDMSYMFNSAYTFDQDISGWDTSSNYYMGAMFYYAESFNQPIGKWDTSNNYELSGTFAKAIKFNSPVNKWNTDKVLAMKSCFEGALVFNQKLSEWNTTSVKSMQYMFMGAEAFDKKVGAWDVGKVTNMTYMFADSYFDQPLQDWKTFKVKDMFAMFERASFNQPIDAWGVKNVERFDYMFEYAENFNQCLDSWAKKSGDDVSTEQMFVESGCPLGVDTPNPVSGAWCSDSCGADDDDDAGICDDTVGDFPLGTGTENCADIKELKPSKQEAKCDNKKAIRNNCPSICNEGCKIPKKCKDNPNFTFSGSLKCEDIKVQFSKKCNKKKVKKNCKLKCDPDCVPPLLQE